MGRTGTQSNVAPQVQGQKIATQNDIVPRKEAQLSAITTVYGQSQQSVQKADLSSRLYSGINNGQNGQIGQYATIAPDQICPRNKKSIDKRDGKTTDPPAKSHKALTLLQMSARSLTVTSSHPPNTRTRQQSSPLVYSKSKHLFPFYFFIF